MIALLLLAATAWAIEIRVVHDGDTVESIAADLGDVALASAIRSANGLRPDDQPVVGQLLAMPDAAEAGADRAGFVLSLTGSGTATTATAPPVPLAVGAEVPVGSAVCVDDTSYATLRLATAVDAYMHDDVSLMPGTCVTVDASFARPGRRVSLLTLERGGVAVATASDPDGRVAVRTRGALTAGAGGGFRVALEDSASRTEALTRPTSVIARGVEVVLQPGEGLRVGFDEAPGPPVALLTGANLLLPPDGSELRRPEFHWRPVDRALGYQLELATSEDFTHLVHQEQVPAPEWSPEFLYLPYRVPAVWWRVSPIDRTGLVGAPTAARVLTFPTGVGP